MPSFSSWLDNETGQWKITERCWSPGGWGTFYRPSPGIFKSRADAELHIKNNLDDHHKTWNLDKRVYE
jgi:hypothetical protein